MAKKDKRMTAQPDVDELSIDDKRSENEKLMRKLTNKNEDYIVKLNRQLKDRGWDDDQVTEALYGMLPTIVEQQDNHITARKLYGTVTEQADHITAGPNVTRDPAEKSPTWQLYIDGALLLGGLLALINGAFQLFGSETQNPMGILTLFANFLLAGVAMLVIGRYAPAPGQKGGFLKYILASTLTMIAWMFIFSIVAAFIPPAINPPVSASVSLLIGIGALVAKYFFKQAFDVRGSLM